MDFATILGIVGFLLLFLWIRVSYKAWKKDYLEMKARKNNSQFLKVNLNDISQEDESWKRDK